MPPRQMRMADGLFDNRYRYNYIYPRGRSGETLRAVDTRNDDRPVVIKRPNPNDAPPIRAGQEVSIINERDALTRLAGHPVLTELLGSGQFFVGGIPHQYIVMERAEGAIIADEVVELAGQHQRLPVLEMLDIIDRLINLLRSAHDNDIVYNDVDAKHLFWNREKYQLKVIDWGNAVFLEGDEATPQGISRQTDLFQLGELLYFLLSGGRRVEVPRDADADFEVNFHQDSASIDMSLRAIVTRAVHPNLRYRYASLSEISADLLRYRTPLESDRNAIVTRALDKLKAQDLSRNDLLALQTNLGTALRQNPAYPAARNANQEIIDRLRDLEVSADLDAVKIYMQGEHWASAAELLTELRERAGSKTGALVRLLLDWCLILMDRQPPAPNEVAQSIAMLFDYRVDKASNLLLASEPSDEPSRDMQWRMAERLTSHFPDVLLLQPNLFRLEGAIQQLEVEGIPVDEAQGILRGIQRVQRQAAQTENPAAGALRDSYREMVDHLSQLNANLQTLSLQHEFSERRLPLNALTRALNAAMALADNMHVIGKQAANNPRDALTALDASRAIDPPNPVWDTIEDFLSLLYEILQNSQTYVPAADGSDLEKWLMAKHEELTPFASQLFDKMLSEMLEGISTAQSAWQRYRDVIVAGDRAEAMDALETAAETVSAISPTLSSWFNELRTVVEKALYVERHSLPGHLGRTLADGWAAFDRGQLADAQRLGQQALEIARSDSEQFISDRLWKLSRALREWVERNGVESEKRTTKALLDIEDLFTDGENRDINGFSTQMPSTETYLKAMGQGLVGGFANSNTAALRILFAQYILSGVLDAHDGAINDARFWRAAALRALPNAAEKHQALRKLDEFIARRESLLGAQAILNQVTGAHISDSIAELARQLEGNPEARLLAPGIQSLRALDSALQDWADAEFRAAGNKIEQALRGISEAESNAGIVLKAYRAWIEELNAALSKLGVNRRSLMQKIDRNLDEPQAIVREAIHFQADVTEDLLGFKHAQMMLGWRDTYEAFLSVYQSDKRRSQKLEALDELFKAMFIDRNPAYPLFRHWYRVVEALPVEPEPPEEEAEAITAPEPVEHAKPPEPIPMETDADSTERSGGGKRWLFNLALAAGLILVIGGLLSLAGSGRLEDMLAALLPEPATTEAVATKTAAAPRKVALPLEESDDAEAGAPTLAPTSLPAPTEPPAPTQASAAEPTAAPTLDLPAAGLQGAQALLDLFGSAAAQPLLAESNFRRQNGSWRLGSVDASEGGTRYLYPPGDLLERQYGNDAASRISGAEAEITLQNTNPAEDEVYFGIAFRSETDAEIAGIQVQQVGPQVISLALYRNGEADFVSQRQANNVIARLRLARDAASGAVSAYFNDMLVGDPMEFAPADAGVLPVIFVKDGVVIGVSSWDVTLE